MCCVIRYAEGSNPTLEGGVDSVVGMTHMLLQARRILNLIRNLNLNLKLKLKRNLNLNLKLNLHLNLNLTLNLNLNLNLKLKLTLTLTLTLLPGILHGAWVNIGCDDDKKAVFSTANALYPYSPPANPSADFANNYGF